MFRKKLRKTNQQQLRGELNRLGTEVVRAAALSDQETERSASSPFLFTRIRAEIDARKRLEAGVRERKPVRGVGGAGLIVGTLKLSLATLLVLVATAFWTVRTRSMEQARYQWWDQYGGQPVPKAIAPSEIGLTACSLSAADKCVISTNDVVQLVVNSNSREPGK
jgi:hypothetical protein